ncbi:MAG: hypothetical protein CMF25_05625 [Kangiellaceae bacterium]|nr:hypothetical protein [Kangiellaceae bacterium]|tara:strand:- start:20106 stop:21149 length:1044 start_codon:yes stop_codon:yes gene_type:complete
MTDELFANDESEEVLPPWPILVVDDDEFVHQLTRLALSSLVYGGRKLEFTSVYSAQEAKDLLRTGCKFAVVLLDVVMETEDAGFRVVDFIRDEIQDKDIRIVIRTGQPGDLQEDHVVANYDINDYRVKSELPVQTLNSVMYANLRSYAEVQQLKAKLTHSEPPTTDMAVVVDWIKQQHRLGSWQAYYSTLCELITKVVTPSPSYCALLELSDQQSTCLAVAPERLEKAMTQPEDVIGHERIAELVAWAGSGKLRASEDDISCVLSMGDHDVIVAYMPINGEHISTELLQAVLPILRYYVTHARLIEFGRVSGDELTQEISHLMSSCPENLRNTLHLLAGYLLMENQD